MKIRKAKEGLENKYTEESGQQVSCPICNKVWNTDFEGDVTHSTCEHLRFYYFDDDFVDFYGNWDYESFKKSYGEITERMIDEEGGLDAVEAFKEIKAGDVDEAIYVQFDDAPMCQPVGIWGYKK